MKIMITGGTGYIGSNLKTYCATIGHHVIRFNRGDHFWKIRDIKPDVIFHCAAEIYKEDEMFSSNVELTYYLLKAAEVAQTRAFIYVGSSSEYGRKVTQRTETDYLAPETWYEATKGCGSLLTLASNLPAIIARPFSVYGRNEPYRRFIPLIYNCYINDTLLSVGPGVHDFIYIDDFVTGLIFSMNRILSGDTYKDTINFGTGIQTSNIELVKLFEQVSGKKLNWQPSEQRKSYDSTSWCCDTRYADSLGWRSQTNLSEGLAKYIQFRQDNPTAHIRN